MERPEKFANLIKELAAEFLETVADRTSLITVTGANASPDLKRVTVFISVLPDNKAEAALNFAKRQGGEFRATLKKKLEMKVIPFVEFALDIGEKNRQKIDELLR